MTVSLEAMAKSLARLAACGDPSIGLGFRGLGVEGLGLRVEG